MNLKGLSVCAALAASALLFGSARGDSLNVELVGWLNGWGDANCVAVAGDYAYVATNETGLRVVDISDPSQPREVGSYAPPSIINSLVVDGSYIYVATGDSGLRVVDVSDPAQAYEIGFYDTPGFAAEVAISGNLACIADGDSGLRVVDISDPTQPNEVGVYQTPDYATCVATLSNFAYMATLETEGCLPSNIYVVDISDPSQPSEISSIEFWGYFYDVEVSGNLVYLTTLSWGEMAFGLKPQDGGYCRSTLTLLDVSDPAQPNEIGEYIEENDYCSYYPFTSMAVAGQWIFLVGNDAEYNSPNKLKVLDISDPTAPCMIAECDLPRSAEWQDCPHAVAVEGSHAYVADGFNSLQVVDISEPNQPLKDGCYDLPDSLGNVAIEGNYAYLTDYNCGLRMVDTSNPSRPRVIGSYSLLKRESGEYKVCDVAVMGNFAYLVYEDEHYGNELGGLGVLDVSDPSHPSELGFCDMNNGWGDHFNYRVAIAGDYAYIAGRGEIFVVDVSDSTQPREAGSLDFDGEALDMAVTGNYAYVAVEDSSLRVVDVSNPAQPREIGFCSTVGRALAVAVDGNYAYVAVEDSALRVLDVSDPTQPRQVGCYNTPGSAIGVEVAENHAYVLGGNDGLLVVDVSDPTQPCQCGFYDTPGNALGVAVAGNYSYIADGTSFLILDCSVALSAPPASVFIPHPSSFILSTFPNPFNSSTSIRFNLATPGLVHLEVYDPLGRRVRELIPGNNLSAGEHSVLLNCAELSSGVYALRLGKGDMTTAKMVNLVK